jgi:hypothetical protein
VRELVGLGQLVGLGLLVEQEQKSSVQLLEVVEFHRLAQLLAQE